MHHSSFIVGKFGQVNNFFQLKLGNRIFKTQVTLNENVDLTRSVKVKIKTKLTCRVEKLKKKKLINSLCL